MFDGAEQVGSRRRQRTTHVELGQVIELPENGRPSATEVVVKAAPPPHQLLLQALEDLEAEHVISHSAREDAEWMMWAAIDGFTELATNGPLQSRPRPELERLARRTMNAIIAGLSASPSGRGPSERGP